MSSVKRKICLVVMIILVTGCLSACSQQSADVQSDKTETTEQTNYREGFSVREISDDLFDRMRTGKTYKEDCSHPRAHELRRIRRPEVRKDKEQERADLSHGNNDPQQEREQIRKAVAFSAVHDHAVGDQDDRHPQEDHQCQDGQRPGRSALMDACDHTEQRRCSQHREQQADDVPEPAPVIGDGDRQYSPEDQAGDRY